MIPKDTPSDLANLSGVPSDLTEGEAARPFEQSSAIRARYLGIALDVGERLFVILLAVPFLIAFGKSFSAHPQFILAVTSEMLQVVLVLMRRPGIMGSRSVAIFAAFSGTALPLLARPGGYVVAPVFISSTLMLSGLCLSILAKLYLNRSFGLIPANRGIKIGGPYRIVRHPMYLGYVVNQLGFLIASFSITNFAIYALAWTFQIIRINEEERLLMRDRAYLAFAKRVPARIIPGVY